MRLTCPNCDAQYEVPDDVIPQDGRDVQCSNCGNTWFQAHADQLSEAAEELPDDARKTAWAPETPDSETLNDITPPDADDARETLTEDGPISMAADAPDAVLAEAVKAAIRRARPQASQPSDEQVTEPDETQIEAGRSDANSERDFEDDLDAALGETHQADPVPEEEVTEEPQDDHHHDAQPEASSEDDIYFEPSSDQAPHDDADETSEPKRRTIDPTVANILQEEAAFEADRRAEETNLESQPDLGLDEPMDDAAKRAQQARERMARMRGISPEAADQPIEPVPENSRRDLLPDIEEINSTLRATEDRAPEEQPDGRPTIGQRRAGGRRMGFALALLLVAAAALIYTRPELVTENVPGSDGPVAGFINFVDNMRVQLDTQMTRLMLWLDGMSSE